MTATWFQTERAVCRLAFAGIRSRLRTLRLRLGYAIEVLLAQGPDKSESPWRQTHVLLQSRGGVFGDAIYLCANGKRHYVSSPERVRDLGFRFPEDLVPVPDSVLKAFAVGGHVPAAYPPQTDPATIHSSVVMREYMACKLVGIGLEVGAGASPFPVPLNCRVFYGDRIPHDRLVAERYPGQQVHNLVDPDFLTSFDDFRGVADDSLDFIIGCHVIEHTLSPVGSILTAHRKLRAGGSLVLVVPDKERTFDKARPLTTLEHVLLDYERPDPKRDYEHYEEFYRLAFPTPDDRFKHTVDEQYAKGGDLHIHVWNHASFMEMVDYIQKNMVSWSSIWSHPTLPDREQDIEFYCLLTK